MKTSYEHYKEYQKTVRSILRQYKIKLKDYNNFEEKGELKDRLKAFYAFYYKMEKEIRAEGKKTLMMAKGLPEFDTLEFNVEIYKMRKGCEFISKNKPQLVVIFNHSAIKSKE